MRDLSLLDALRQVEIERKLYGVRGDSTCGLFFVKSPIDAQTLRVIASNGEGWDHVSVSRERRTPNWLEMEHVKRLFFRDDECAMQLHVPETEHINCHPFCLHIWRPHAVDIPRPPNIMVGLPKDEGAPVT